MQTERERERESHLKWGGLNEERREGGRAEGCGTLKETASSELCRSYLRSNVRHTTCMRLAAHIYTKAALDYININLHWYPHDKSVFGSCLLLP